MTDKTTFVLGGAGMFEEGKLEEYLSRSDAKVLLVEDYPQLADAVNKIPKDGNGIHVVLAAHGGADGKFEWNSAEAAVPYGALFRALPREGIAVVTISSCYGGTALEEELLRAAPPGAVVISLSSTGSLSSGNFTRRFAAETEELTTPVDIYLEALDNFDPEEYRKYSEYWNARKNDHDDADPEHALPRIIGIGGDPPQQIDMDEKLQELVGKVSPRADDPTAWRRAVERVKLRFDRVNYRCDNDPHYPPEALTCTFSDTDRSGYATDEAQSVAIDAVAAKIQTGSFTPATMEERRIARALTVAHMDASGELDRLRAQAIDPNWLAGKTIETATLNTLQHNGWEPGPDGKDHSARNGRVDLTEIQAMFRRLGIHSEDVDRDDNGTLEACEIARALNTPAPKDRGLIARFFLG